MSKSRKVEAGPVSSAPEEAAIETGQGLMPHSSSMVAAVGEVMLGDRVAAARRSDPVRGARVSRTMMDTMRRRVVGPAGQFNS